jgi:hypothetical protein
MLISKKSRRLLQVEVTGLQQLEVATQVEHRHDPRLDMRKSILVHVNNNTYVNGITRDISYGGLALESHQTQSLAKNAVVRAAFMADGRLVILPSQVVRINDNEVALMFIERASPRMEKINSWLKDALRALKKASAAGKDTLTSASSGQIT